MMPARRPQTIKDGAPELSYSRVLVFVYEFVCVFECAPGLATHCAFLDCPFTDRDRCAAARRTVQTAVSSTCSSAASALVSSCHESTGGMMTLGCADGHVAFNEPGSSLHSRTRLKTLALETVNDNKQVCLPPLCTRCE